MNESRRRQDRKMKYKECSSVYGLEILHFMSTKKIVNLESYPIVINQFEALDINNYEDIEYMEYLMRNSDEDF